MRKLLVATALALAILPGCAIFDRDKDRPTSEQVKPRDVTATRIVEAYTAVTATAELASIALKTGSISGAQARKISNLTKIALTAIDKSTEEYVTGDRAKSAAALNAALAAVEEARLLAKAETGGKK